MSKQEFLYRLETLLMDLPKDERTMPWTIMSSTLKRQARSGSRKLSGNWKPGEGFPHDPLRRRSGRILEKIF